MSYTFIEAPTPVSRPEYREALRRMQDRLVGQPGLVAVYQIGSISTPGVSDIDMVVVFEDEAVCGFDPLAELSEADRYLFIHSLYGAPAAHFEAAQRYSFFHNYQILSGTDLLDATATPTGGDEQKLKVQIALEYLLKMYISLVMQRTYGVFKLRSFFLHVKAVQYDLDFLGVAAGPLTDLTQQFIRWRSAWFKQPPTPQMLTVALDEFFGTLEAFLRHRFDLDAFYLPERTRYRLARCLWLEPGPELGFRHNGYSLPPYFSRYERTYFKVQNRLNRFHFMCPVQDAMPPVLAQRFALVGAMKKYNQRCLPHFATMSSSLHLT